MVGRPAERLPARGTGVTMPLAIGSLLLDNGVPESVVPDLLPRMVELLPKRLVAHTKDLRGQGVVMPGAVAALEAVQGHEQWVPTVVTGNLKPNALLKLAVFNLDGYLDTDIGGFASDNDHRPALVGIAQKRAQAKHGTLFTRANTVIIGDSLEDVRTGLEGVHRSLAWPRARPHETNLEQQGLTSSSTAWKTSRSSESPLRK